MRVTVEGMFDGWWFAIRTKQLDKFRSAHAAEDALVQMNRVIGWATFSFRPNPLLDDHDVSDGSDAAVDISKTGAGGPLCGIWAPESPPATTVIDRHTRFEVGAAAAVVKRPKSGGRPSTPNSGRLGPRGSLLTRSQSSIAMENTQLSEDKVEIKDLSDPTERSGRKGNQYHLSDVEREYFAQIEAEKESKVRREAAEAQRLAEAARVKAVWDEAMRDVEGKQWTVDSEGKVIVVNPVEGDKMASRTVPVKYNMGDKKGGDGSTVNSRDRKGQGGASGSGSGGGHWAAGKGKKGGASGPSHYDESFDSQPSLMATLLNEDGVDLTYGNQSKQGRQFNGGEGHMSKAQYHEKTGFAVVGDRTSSVDEFDGDPAGGDVPKGKNKGRGGKNAAATENKFPIIDPFKGGRPRSLDPSEPLSPHGLPPTGVSVVSPGALGSPESWGGSKKGSPPRQLSYEEFREREATAVAEEREQIAKLNRESSFGGNGAVEPTPIQRNRGQVLPHKHQRDVRNANLWGPAPTAYRSKLAPPTVPGMTTGHGLVGAPDSGGGSAVAALDSTNERGSIDSGIPSKGATGGLRKPVVVIPEASESKGLRFQVAA
jgi:hypothetical protein